MSLLHGVVSCPLCGRSGGGIAEAADRCHACLARDEPTPLQEWAQASGVRLKTLVEHGLNEKAIDRAAKGQRMSATVAAKLAEATGLDVEDFTERARHQEWKP